MKKSITIGLALAVFGATAAIAGVVQDRQDLMKANNAASRTLGGMARGTTPYDKAAANAQLQILVDNSAKLPSLFPAGSDKDEGTVKSGATPAVWSDNAGFIAASTKLATDAKTAMAATDQASFAMAFQAVQGDCGGCHRTYRKPPAPRPAPPAAQ